MNKEEEWYDIAQICLKGHIINFKAKSKPERNVEYCNKCGSQTIMKCQHCKTPIKGYHHKPRRIRPIPKEPPRFCHKCGKPYPWADS